MAEKLKDCTCKDWSKHIPEIDGFITMAVVHGSSGYRGKQFQFCPWCGKKREPEDKGKPHG